jgi:hypothetical protein
MSPGLLNLPGITLVLKAGLALPGHLLVLDAHGLVQAQRRAGGEWEGVRWAGHPRGSQLGPGIGKGAGKRRRRCALVSHEQPHLATESGLKYS